MHGNQTCIYIIPAFCKEIFHPGQNLFSEAFVIMDDPDFSVSLVKIESTSQDEETKESEIPNNSNLIGSSKDCHTLWDTLRQQGQLFKVLDTLTSKMARLVGRIQNQTASEEDSVTVVELLSQLGIMFVDTETKEDGSKEKRFTFVTDAESSLPRQPLTAPQSTDKPQPILLLNSNATETGVESDEDHPDPFEPLDEPDDTMGDIPDAELPAFICEWCREDQGTPFMLDLHLLQNCKVLTHFKDYSMSCPRCKRGFRQLLRLQTHLLVEHGLESTEVLEILHELEEKVNKQRVADEKGEASQSSDESDVSSESEATEKPTKLQMVCEVCQEKLGTRIDLRSHLMGVHAFSRQKAVNSVYKSVKTAQIPSPSKPKSHAPKTHAKELGYFFKCTECDKSFKDRTKLVKHLKSVHFITQFKALKEGNRQYKELNSTFACDLCPRKYCNRYLLNKHFFEAHQLSKGQARLKSSEMYPHASSVEKPVRKLTVRPSPSMRSRKARELKSKNEDTDDEAIGSDKQPQRSPRSAHKRGRGRPRKSRRLARKGIKADEIIEDGEDEQENHGNSMVDDEGNHGNVDKENSISDLDQEAERDDNDEDFVPSELEDKTSSSEKQAKKKSQRKASRVSDDEEYVLQDSESETAKKKVEPKLTTQPDSVMVENENEEKGDEHADGEEPNESEKPPKKKGKRGRRPNVEGKHKCPHCDKSFLHLNYAKLHISTVHKEKPAYQCSTCQKPFYFKTTFIRHLNCHMNEEMGINFTCEVCGKCFKDNHSLITHRKIHIKDLPFKCEFCDKSFFHQSLLLRHRNLHTKETEYKCKHCDRVFYRKGGLTYHMASIHDNKRDHICANCGLGFASKSALVAHGHTHSTVRTFQCDICGTQVKTKGNLKEHMRCVHTEERAYKCEICQKAFNRSHRLTLHMMMHRDERPHKCHLCDKGFRTRTNLRVHIKWHQDQRDFQCEQCGKTFLIPGNLDRHMKTHRSGKTHRKKSTKKPAAETVPQTTDQTQLATHMEVPPSQPVENQYQTVQNLVSGAGFESDLPTLASIAQHLSTMNIPVFQASNTAGQTSIPVAINRDENTCTLLPGSVISGEASAALAAFSHAQQQLQGPATGPPVVTQSVQGNFEQIELTL
ncbi:zinc finger protein 91-like [Patiria miniata]|uniref:C2H2-type domain-containing protein n=1 Tax=Patiria miniata TaxID=46514 RepID=A0A914ABP8_PATMI|nr:zinc finger protein 91-like [Patiria miniata]